MAPFKPLKDKIFMSFLSITDQLCDCHYLCALKSNTESRFFQLGSFGRSFKTPNDRRASQRHPRISTTATTTPNVSFLHGRDRRSTACFARLHTRSPTTHRFRLSNQKTSSVQRRNHTLSTAPAWSHASDCKLRKRTRTHKHTHSVLRRGGGATGKTNGFNCLFKKTNQAELAILSHCSPPVMLVCYSSDATH